MSRAIITQTWSDVMPSVALGADATRSDAARDELIGLYAGADRHYHGLAHIAAMLADLTMYGGGLRDRDAVVLAILYHDAIYEPRRSDNEAASAAMAGDRLTALGCAPARVARIEELILATHHGLTAVAPDDHDLALLVDIDLAILAAPPAIYQDYAQAIHREYAHVGDTDYRAGRARVLGAFLDRDAIYATDGLRDRWEATARANLATEIAALSDGGCAAGPISA